MDNKFISLTLQIGKREISIAKNAPYRLLNIEGIEASEYAVELSENATLDGAFLANKRVLPRQIDMSIEVADIKNSEQYRKLLISFLTPKQSGVLTVRRPNVERKISFELQGVTFQQETLYAPLQINLTLICADPFFRDGNDHVREMIEKIPLLTFPFNSVAGVGITAGLQRRVDTITIENTGDTPIGVVVDMLADNGKVQNPYISSNGKFVKILDMLQINDTLQISTNPGAKRIVKNGVSIFKFDRRSIFFSLPVGVNELTVSADLYADNMSSTITYSLRYLGV